MNPIQKILHSTIVTINSLLDKIDKNTANTIKQSYYLLMTIAVIIATAVGFVSGKSSAEKKGIQIISSTNDAFEIDIKRKRDDGTFKTMLADEFIEEKDKLQLSNEQYTMPTNRMIENKNIIEPENDIKDKFTFPKSIDKNKLADTPSTDTIKTESSIKELEKKVFKRDTKNDIIMKNKSNTLEKQNQTNKTNNINLKPINKKRQVAE